MTTDDRMALRQGSDGFLDDAFVKQVEMLRAELLDRNHLWLCCYLPNTGVEGDRVTFEVIARNGGLEFSAIEMPTGDVSVERTD